MVAFKNGMIEIVQGDITNMTTDAIVNAANEMLAHGGGVAGAIVRKGGTIIQEESAAWVRQHGRVPTGSAAITTAGNLPSRYVIHAVGPIYGSGDEDEKLRSATLSALALADQQKLKSIAFPAISTGIFGFPLDRCARVMLKAVMDYLSRPTCIERVVFCLWDRRALEIFQRTFAELSTREKGS